MTPDLSMLADEIRGDTARSELRVSNREAWSRRTPIKVVVQPGSDPCGPQPSVGLTVMRFPRGRGRRRVERFRSELPFDALTPKLNSGSQVHNNIASDRSATQA